MKTKQTDHKKQIDALKAKQQLNTIPVRKENVDWEYVANILLLESIQSTLKEKND